MRLSAVIGAPVNPDPEIVGLTADSRAVRPGFLFAALAGLREDGARYVADAVSRGAAAVLAAPGVVAPVPVVADPHPRRRFALAAARFHQRQPARIVGVTGTNGKTSTALFAQHLWTKAGRRAGSIGTLGARTDGWRRALQHTTPEPATLHEVLDAMADAGVERLAMEVSSHAVAQCRVDGVRFAGAAFTNITQDHLDYHADFGDYFAAKLQLFDRLLPADGFAVVNADGAGAARVVETLRQRGVRTLTTGRAGVDLRLLSVDPTPDGLLLKVAASGAAHTVALPLIGAFQAENALLAAGLVIADGEAAVDVLGQLATLEGAPGRMQRAGHVDGAAIYVDYAHTPDAVEKALAAARPHASGRVIVIIGAGGDRDRAKRPLMGEAAARAADLVIVTDDNPRSEQPAAIRAGVLAGAPDAAEIGDRAEAIHFGVSMLRPGDILVIAGKGHETGQVVGDRILPFDDFEVARAAVERRGGKQ